MIRGIWVNTTVFFIFRIQSKTICITVNKGFRRFSCILPFFITIRLIYQLVAILIFEISIISVTIIQRAGSIKQQTRLNSSCRSYSSIVCRFFIPIRQTFITCFLQFIINILYTLIHTTTRNTHFINRTIYVYLYFRHNYKRAIPTENAKVIVSTQETGFCLILCFQFVGNVNILTHIYMRDKSGSRTNGLIITTPFLSPSF